ncbi:hypothetical protein QTP88_005122 [Uroleucon formosanum]
MCPRVCFCGMFVSFGKGLTAAEANGVALYYMGLNSMRTDLSREASQGGGSGGVSGGGVRERVLRGYYRWVTKTGSHRRRGRRTGCRAARAESIRRARRTTMRDRRRPHHHGPDHHRRNAHESVGARQAEYPGGGGSGMGRPVAQLPDRANNPGESSPGPRRARTIALADGRSLAHIHTRTHTHTHTHLYTRTCNNTHARANTLFPIFPVLFIPRLLSLLRGGVSLSAARARAVSLALSRALVVSLSRSPSSAKRTARASHSAPRIGTSRTCVYASPAPWAYPG